MVDNLNYGTRNQKIREARLYNLAHPDEFYGKKIAALEKRIRNAKSRTSKYIHALEDQIGQYKAQLDEANNPPPSQEPVDDTVELCY